MKNDKLEEYAITISDEISNTIISSYKVLASNEFAAKCSMYDALCDIDCKLLVVLVEKNGVFISKAFIKTSSLKQLQSYDKYLLKESDCYKLL